MHSLTYTHVRTHTHCSQEVDVVFQRILQEIEKQFGTHEESGCVVL